jgi:hypothetical protein
MQAVFGMVGMVRPPAVHWMRSTYAACVRSFYEVWLATGAHQFCNHTVLHGSSPSALGGC